MRPDNQGQGPGETSDAVIEAKILFRRQCGLTSVFANLNFVVSYASSVFIDSLLW